MSCSASTPQFQKTLLLSLIGGPGLCKCQRCRPVGRVCVECRRRGVWLLCNALNFIEHTPVPTESDEIEIRPTAVIANACEIGDDEIAALFLLFCSGEKYSSETLSR